MDIVNVGPDGDKSAHDLSSDLLWESLFTDLRKGSYDAVSWALLARRPRRQGTSLRARHRFGHQIFRTGFRIAALSASVRAGSRGHRFCFTVCQTLSRGVHTASASPLRHQILAQASSPSSHSPSFSPSQTQRGEDNGFRPMSSRGRDVQADSHNVFRSTSPRLRFSVTMTPSNASGRTGRGSGSRGFALISRSRVVALPTDSLRQRQPLLTPSASTW